MGNSDKNIPEKEADFKHIWHIISQYVLPSLISTLLIVVFFREVNLRQVWQIVRGDCNMWMIGLMMIFSVMAIAIRGIRWGIQLRGVGIPRMPALAEMSALLSASVLNVAFPRLGEAWRCIYVSRRQHCPFMTVLGTDIGDRTCDLICVFAFIAIALGVAHSEIINFMHHYEVGRVIGDVIDRLWVWIAIVVVVCALLALMRYGSRYEWVESMKKGLSNMWQGFAVLFRMPQLGLYVWLTVLLWGATYMATYVAYFAFPFTRDLILEPHMHWGISMGFVTLLFGVCSTAVPSNGGLGPWTLAIAYSLEVFGVAKEDAVSYALVVWGFQTIAYMISGGASFVYIYYHRRKERLMEEHGAQSH